MNTTFYFNFPIVLLIYFLIQLDSLILAVFLVFSFIVSRGKVVFLIIAIWLSLHSNSNYLAFKLQELGMPSRQSEPYSLLTVSITETMKVAKKA